MQVMNLASLSHSLQLFIFAKMTIKREKFQQLKLSSQNCDCIEALKWCILWNMYTTTTTEMFENEHEKFNRIASKKVSRLLLYFCNIEIYFVLCKFEPLPCYVLWYIKMYKTIFACMVNTMHFIIRNRLVIHKARRRWKNQNWRWMPQTWAAKTHVKFEIFIHESV